MNKTQPDQRRLRVAIIEENSIRAAILLEGLREAGIVETEVIESMTNLLRRLSTMNPDVIIIGIENPSRDVLEQMFQVSKLVARPVAMFVDRSDGTMIQVSARFSGMTARLSR